MKKIILIRKPVRIKAAGNKIKIIEEYVGRVNSATTAASIAVMKSPCGWQEPGQTPRFDEYTLVLKGQLQVESRHQAWTVKAGEAIIVPKGNWVRYSSPDRGGAQYIAVCLPAFSPKTVHRDPV